MDANKIKNSDQLKKLTSLYFRTLKPVNDQTKMNVAQISFLNYAELGYVIVDMLKLCILALEQDAHQTSQTNKNGAINVSLILENIVELIPLHEFEFLSEINYLLAQDSITKE